GTAKAPTKGLATLPRRAFARAVYAAPCALPGVDARRAARRWSAATGRARARKVPTEGFRVLRYISASFPKLCLAQSQRPRYPPALRVPRNTAPALVSLYFCHPRPVNAYPLGHWPVARRATVAASLCSARR